MATKQEDLSLDHLRELTSLLGLQVQGDRRKKLTYVVALSEFLSLRMKSKRLEGLFELNASTPVSAIYKALEF
ncbi:MAG TPA: hypothetical protein V6C78_06710 [Crinalium sp.]|jgi:hypothetical protein